MDQVRKAPQRSAAAEAYRKIFDDRSAAEIRTLAHIKRFMERLTADPVFRGKLRDNLGNSKAVAAEYGIDLDPEEMLPLFRTDYMQYRFNEAETRWPLAAAWDDYIGEMLGNLHLLRQSGDCAEVNPRFHAWRQRQILRADSELGGSGKSITHPVVAIELSAGCSVGCWFCGISADKFQGNFLYTEENAALWRAVLDEMVAVLGPAAQSGFCYWATDPSDNPDYPKFIEDYYFATGSLPQTTTAAPLKNVALTREVMQLFDTYRCVTNRFSILNLKLLNAVHAEFTAEELMGVELVMQNREALMVKANAGRAMERRRKLREAGKSEKIAEIEGDHSTIACVSGFLVNMVSRTIRLVSPTRASERWPLGYRVFGERQFRTAAEFRAAMDDLIARHVPEDIAGHDVLRFRDDLEYRRMPDGFELHATATRTSVRGFESAGLLGDLLHEGKRTAGELHAALADAGADIFMMAEVLQHLFEGGLLNEDPKLAGIGTAPAPLVRAG